MTTKAKMKPLLDWYADEIRRIFSETPRRGQGMVLSGCAWGEKFLKRFGDYCLSSLCAPDNLAALNGCRIILFTDVDSRDRAIGMLHPLSSYGVDPEVRDIPDPVFQLWKDDHWNRFPILGTCQTLAIIMAGRANMGFHALYPDHIVGPQYYANLKELASRHHAVIQMSMSADLGQAKAAIERYRQPDGELIIPDLELGSLAWCYLHKQMHNLLMNNAQIPDRLPFGHFLLWQGRDRIRIHSPHHNPAWFCPDLCQRFRPRVIREITSPIDTRLPLLLHGSNTYVTGIDDGMAFIEVSDDDKLMGVWHDGFNFAMDCWRRVGFGDDYRGLFEQPCEVAIVPQSTFLTMEEIERQFGQVCEILDSERPYVDRAALQALFHGRMPHREERPAL